MTRSRDFHVSTAAQRWSVVQWLSSLDLARWPHGLDVRVSVHEEPMTPGQRAMVCALCEEIAEQMDWPLGGRADGDEWRHLLVAAFRRERQAERGGERTSVDGSIRGMSKRTASDLIEFLNAWCVEHDVRVRA